MSKGFNENLFLRVNSFNPMNKPAALDVTCTVHSHGFKFSPGKDHLPLTLIYNSGADAEIETARGSSYTLHDSSFMIFNNSTAFNISCRKGESSLLFSYFGSAHVNHNVQFIETVFKQHPELSLLANSVSHRIAKKLDDRIFEQEAFINMMSNMLSLQSSIEQDSSKLNITRKALRLEVYKRLLKAKEYIDHSYSLKIDLNDISREACMSKFHLIKLFKAVYGLSPGQYLRKVRIDKAAEILISTETSISNIVSEIGFESLPSFSYLFKQVKGLSPKDYRQNQYRLKRNSQ